MGDWRGNQSRNYQQQQHHHHPRSLSRSQPPRKPPVGSSGSWRPAVPSWEKRFCYSVGSFKWGRLLEAQKVMTLYKNVIQWNDSAGEEAFQNAKMRFWSEMNGFQCEISLPNPDAYIDAVDWDSEIDPELLVDLERQPEPPVEDENGGKAEFRGDSLFFMNQPVVCSGWGDTEEVPTRASDPHLGNCNEVSGNEDNSWDQYCPENNENGAERTETEEKTWGDCGDDGWGWNIHQPKQESNRDGGWGWNIHQPKQESSNPYFLKHKNSSYQTDDCQHDHWRRNGRGRKRSSFGHENYMAEKKPLAQREWNGLYSCGPITHRGCGEMQHSLNFEKIL